MLLYQTYTNQKRNSSVLLHCSINCNSDANLKTGYMKQSISPIQMNGRTVFFSPQRMICSESAFSTSVFCFSQEFCMYSRKNPNTTNRASTTDRLLQSLSVLSQTRNIWPDWLLHHYVTQRSPSCQRRAVTISGGCSIFCPSQLLPSPSCLFLLSVCLSLRLLYLHIQQWETAVSLVN